MKKFFYILFFILSTQSSSAQDEGPGEVKMREKLVEYVQKRLGLTQAEAEKFQPVFRSYFKELKRTNRDLRDKGLEREQKLLEVRLRYRDQFKPIIGEKRSNEVFDHEKEFIKTIRQEIRERLRDRAEGRADKRKNTEKLLAN